MGSGCSHSPVSPYAAAFRSISFRRMAPRFAVLRNARVDEKKLAEAGDAAVGEANVIGDEHGSAAYKRELLRIYVARAIRAALAEK